MPDPLERENVDEARGRHRLGLGMHSCGFHWRAAREGHPDKKFSNATGFLEYAQALGAGGVQVSIQPPDQEVAREIRMRAEKWEMSFEGQVAFPDKEPDWPQFEASLRAARAAGAEVVRTAILGGRRYEVFQSSSQFQEFSRRAWTLLTRVEPLLRRERMKLAIENHKDWRVGELIDLLRRLSSEWIGVTLDTGNSIALLENPMEVVEALAPFALTTHLKDMAIQEHREGFLLSEVPLGQGFLDLKRIKAVCEQANPRIRFNLEMITRDPLLIPCLRDSYWATLDAIPARQLADMLGLVRRHRPANPPPSTNGKSLKECLEFEDANVRASLAYARASLATGG